MTGNGHKKRQKKNNMTTNKQMIQQNNPLLHSLVPMEVEASDSGGMAIECVEALASLCIPYPQHPVCAATNYEVARHLG